MDNILKRMVYSYFKPMWHALTEPSTEPLTAEQIMTRRFGGGFPVVLRPAIVELNGVTQETGDFGIVRGTCPEFPDEVLFGWCTERYKPLQPMDVAMAFDASVKQYVETMAFLGRGEEMFISWTLPDCEIKTALGSDLLNLFGIVRVGFDTLKGARLFTSIYRPVCWNTITMAEGWAKRNTDGNGLGYIFKGKAINHNLLRDLGYWMEHVQGKALEERDLLTSFFGKLAQTPIKSDVEAHTILYEAFPPVQNVSDFFPVQLKDAKAEKINEANEKIAEFRDGVYSLFAGAGTAITPDGYGMVNAVSEYVCHYQPSKKPIAASVMFGARQADTMRMIRTLANRI